MNMLLPDTAAAKNRIIVNVRHIILAVDIDSPGRRSLELSVGAEHSCIIAILNPLLISGNIHNCNKVSGYNLIEQQGKTVHQKPLDRTAVNSTLSQCDFIERQYHTD